MHGGLVPPSPPRLAAPRILPVSPRDNNNKSAAGIESRELKGGIEQKKRLTEKSLESQKKEIFTEEMRRQYITSRSVLGETRTESRSVSHDKVAS